MVGDEHWNEVVYCKLQHTEDPTRGELEVRVTPLLYLYESKERTVVYDDANQVMRPSQNDMTPLGLLFYNTLASCPCTKHVSIVQTEHVAHMTFVAYTVLGYADMLALVCDIIEGIQNGKSPDEVARRLQIA